MRNQTDNFLFLGYSMQGRS